MIVRESHWLRSLVGEHASLRELIQRVETLISEACDGIDHGYLLYLLSELDTLTASHMALEEMDGYLHPVRERLPGATGTIDLLQAEHPRLRDELAQICAAARVGASARELEITTIPRLRQWIVAMRAHEDRENTLMQDAFSDQSAGG